LTVRAQIIADKPTAQDVTPESVSSLSPSSSEQQELSTSAGGCPFLNALADPPEVSIPWYKRLHQITKPTEFQKLLLDDAMAEGHRMVALRKDVGFADAYVLGSGDMVRTAFAGEAGLDPITKQSSIPSFGE
jgi:hypothetical protein